MVLKQTPSQTVGPYFAYALASTQYGYPLKSFAGGSLVSDDTDGEHIRLLGNVIDGEGKVIPDALIEIWQADSQGRYSHPADPNGSNSTFKGFGRFGTGTDAQNRFIFDTVKPGATGSDAAPHINVIVLMRGMLVHAFTRIYFSDEAAANARDPILQSVPPERRATLIAERTKTPAGIVYRIDIHMQGAKETVFFDA